MENCSEAVEQYRFESFGVKIGITSNSPSLLKKIIGKLPEIIPNECFTEIRTETEHNFFIEVRKDTFSLFKNREKLTAGEVEEIFINYFFSRLRLTIAEYAVGKVFLHAGAVSWKEKAIVIPGNSFSGKTTLVAELIKKGAVYYSDEYAVLDEKGLNHPFPKSLSVRGIIDDSKQLEISAETFGGKIGSQPLPVGMIILTQYENGAKWDPKVLSEGNGMMEILPHTIPIRFNPKFALQVLNNVANRAIIAKSKRGDATEVVNLLLRFFEAEAI